MFERTGNTDIVDEYTLGELMDRADAERLLLDHWETVCMVIIVHFLLGFLISFYIYFRGICNALSGLQRTILSLFVKRV